jgi:hypothetical protein
MLGVVLVGYTLLSINRGGFRGGMPPLKFAKHMLYNVN